MASPESLHSLNEADSDFSDPERDDSELSEDNSTDSESPDDAVQQATLQSAASGQPFPKRVTEVLENLYSRGMTGWGKSHGANIEVAMSSTGLTLSQVKNWIRRKNMKRKAAEESLEEMPLPKKRRLTPWQQHLKNYALTEEGKAALGTSHAYFNQKASAVYKQLSASEKEQLSKGPSIRMNKKEVHRRAQRVFKNVQTQFSELDELGYKGFAIAFHGGKSQLVGTPSVLPSFTPQLLEYLHAVVVAAAPPPLIKCGKGQDPQKSTQHEKSKGKHGALSSGARKGDQKDSAPTSRDPKSSHGQNLVPKSKKPTNKSPLADEKDSDPTSKQTRDPKSSQEQDLVPKNKKPTSVRKGDEMSSTVTSRKTRYPKSDLKNQHLTPPPPEKGKKPTGQSKRDADKKRMDEDLEPTKQCKGADKKSSLKPIAKSKLPKKPNSHDPTKEKSDDCKQSETHESSSLITPFQESNTPTPSTTLSGEKAANEKHENYPDSRKNNINTADHKSPNEFWIKSLGLFEHDRRVLLSTQWLNDNIISAAQELLKLSVPDGLEIGGLQSPQCGRHLKFKPVVPREKYIQVLHVDDNHWITVSNIDVGQDTAVADIVFVYDSLLSPKMNLKTKKQVCSLARPSSRTITFDIVNVMGQTNSYDCGLFALAYATELAYGNDPARSHWETATMRNHLISCFEDGFMHQFPTVKLRRLPLGRRVKASFKENIFCVCRMPNDKKISMVQCSSCNKWYHGECISVDIIDLGDQKWSCDECKRFLHAAHS